MAIRYAGAQNLIGYGEAQVYDTSALAKQADVIAQRIGAQKAAKAKAKAAAKKAEGEARKNFLKGLNDIDYSKVRNPDVNHMIKSNEAIINYYSNNMAAINDPSLDGGKAFSTVNKMKNTFRGDINKSTTEKENEGEMYDLMLKDSEHYGNPENMDGITSRRKVSMFGERWYGKEVAGDNLAPEGYKHTEKGSYDVTTEQGKADFETDVAAGYPEIEGEKERLYQPGYADFKMKVDIETSDEFMNIAKEIKPSKISTSPDGKFSLSYGDTVQQFTTKQEAEKADVLNAGYAMLETHPYKEAIMEDIMDITNGDNSKEAVDEAILQMMEPYVQDKYTTQLIKSSPKTKKGSGGDETTNSISVVTGSGADVFGVEGSTELTADFGYTSGWNFVVDSEKASKSTVQIGKTRAYRTEAVIGDKATHAGQTTVAGEYSIIPSGVFKYNTAPKDFTYTNEKGDKVNVKKGELAPSSAFDSAGIQTEEGKWMIAGVTKDTGESFLFPYEEHKSVLDKWGEENGLDIAGAKDEAGYGLSNKDYKVFNENRADISEAAKEKGVSLVEMYKWLKKNKQL